MTSTVQQHALADLCFYCASDAVLEAAVAGRPHPPIDMDSSASACPHWSDGADLQESL